MQGRPLIVAAFWQLNFAVLQFNHAVESALTWLNDNQDAKVDDYKKKRKDVENVCSPILIDAGEAPVNFDDRNEL